MRVLYVVSRFPTFSETFIVREMTELIGRGVDVRIVSLKRPSQSHVQSDAAALLDRVVYPAGMRENAIRSSVAAVRHPWRTGSALARIAWTFRSRPVDLGKTLVVWWRTQGLLPAIGRLRPDHVHAHYATYTSTAALLIADDLRVPFSFTSHAHDVFGPPHLLEEKLRKAAFVVTISDFNKRWFATRSGSTRVNEMQVIHCGVRLDDYPFEPDGREPGAIVGTGWLHEVKGWRYLIDACAMLVARGVAFTCDIVSDGPDRAALEAQIARVGLQDRVRLLGALTQEDLRAHLYRAGVFVLPCVATTTRDIMDGIPVALMEAMAAGAPVVSTTISGIPELVRDGMTGLLAPPRDAASLADCLERLIVDRPLARTLATSARRHVENEFDVRREAGKLFELLCRQDSPDAIRRRRVA
jgi:glycosyltransferase involved in cell wall biosynthesis